MTVGEIVLKCPNPSRSPIHWVSLVNDNSTFMGYLMPKLSLFKIIGGIILAIAEEDKGFKTLPKDISQKLNLTALLEVELVYNNVTVYHVNQYITGTSSLIAKTSSDEDLLIT